MSNKDLTEPLESGINFFCTVQKPDTTQYLNPGAGTYGPVVGDDITGNTLGLLPLTEPDGDGCYQIIMDPTAPTGTGLMFKIRREASGAVLKSTAVEWTERYNWDNPTQTLIRSNSVAATGGGGSNTGPGSDSVTLNFADDVTALPIGDADVWITTDAPGTNVIAGTRQTNSQGNVVFMLDDGVTYYAWMQKDGVNPIRGQQFTAVKD